MTSRMPKAGRTGQPSKEERRRALSDALHLPVLGGKPGSILPEAKKSPPSECSSLRRPQSTV